MPLVDIADDTMQQFVPDDGPVILVFHQQGCPGCNSLRPQLERLSALYPNVPVLRALIKDNPILQSTFGVRAVPAVYAIMREGRCSKAFSEVNPTQLNLAFQMAAGGS